MKAILVRYGELTLKGKNRNKFDSTLFLNIKKMVDINTLTFKKDRSRIYITNINNDDIDYIVDKLKKIPGIHSFFVADVCSNDLEDIKDLALQHFDKTNPEFRVKTKRLFKMYPLLSQEVSRIVGGHILINNDGLEGMKVNLHTPKQVVNIEIQEDNAYVYQELIMGMGGLPIGTAGKGVLLLSGGIDSPVAGLLAMKRGIKLTCVHFSSPPYTSEKSLEKVNSLLAVLQEYDSDIKMINVGFTDIQLAIHKECIDKYEVTILRRMMFRKASLIAKSIKAKTLITGESLGQVASQTIDSMYVTNECVDELIIRPLICYDKYEIINIAKNIGTYEISILPFEDCCVIFLPKNPTTNPKLDLVRIEEEKIDYKEMLVNTIDDVVTKEDLNSKLIDNIL